MHSETYSKTGRLVGMAVLIAVIVILQILGSFVRFGSFSVSLVLIPIVVGAAVFGAAAGALFGAAFGAVVLINCVIGVDLGGFVLWSANPFATAVLCLFKGAAAGYAAGLTYSALRKANTYLGVVCAALVCPVVNTGIFIAAMLLIYRDTLTAWAGGASVLYFAFVGLAGVNFLIETVVNVVLSPAVMRIIRAVKIVV